MEAIRLDKTSQTLFEKREEVIFRCLGCEKTELREPTMENNYCTVFAFPQHKWRMCDCPGATHLKKDVEKQKTRIGQQKQKKKK